MKISLMLLAAASGAFAQPRIVYSKSFPGSVPALVFITFERNGKAVYKESVNDELPLRFELKKEEADEIFALADKLDRFKRPLESGLNVAKMGEKTFRWEENGAGQEVKFNYSQDLEAQKLLEWFEKMSETEQHFIAVERAVKFDKLGANRALLLLQAGMERNRLVGLNQFLPLLERVIKNESYLHMDRERANRLEDWIKNGKPKTEP